MEVRDIPAMDSFLSQFSVQSIFDNLPSIALFVDGMGKIREINREGISQLRIELEKYQGCHISSLLSNIPKHKERFLKKYRSNFILLPEDNEPLYVTGTVLPLFGNDKDEYLGALFVLQDIGRIMNVMKTFTSGKVFLERTLRSQSLREEFHSIIENLSDGVMVLNEELNILHVNHALERLTGKKRENLIGRSLSSVFPELADIELIKQYKYFEAEEIAVTNERGQSRLVEISLAPVRIEESEKLGLALTLKDFRPIEKKWPKIQGILNNEILPMLESAVSVINGEHSAADQTNKLLESVDYVKTQLSNLGKIVRDI